MGLSIISLIRWLKWRLASFSVISKLIYFVEWNVYMSMQYSLDHMLLFSPWFIQSIKPLHRYEGQRDMLYNQTFNLDQVSFAAEGIKDAQQTLCPREPFFFFLTDVYYWKLTLMSSFGMTICVTGLNHSMGNYGITYFFGSIEWLPKNLLKALFVSA